MKVSKCLQSRLLHSVSLGLLLFGVASIQLSAQEAVFSVGILCTKSDISHKPTLTVFADVNYGNIEYLLQGEESVRYTVNTRVHDATKGETILDTTISRAVTATPPPRDLTTLQLQVDTGFYRIECVFVDSKLGIREVENRNVYSIDFTSRPTSLSSILLGTNVTLRDNDTIFTPYFDTNVSSIRTDPIFAFTELYAPIGSNRRIQAFLFHGDSVVGSSAVETLRVVSDRTRVFTLVPTPDSAHLDVLSLKVIALNEQDSILTVSQRLVDYAPDLELPEISDDELDTRILQLRYIAEREEIQKIEDIAGAKGRRAALSTFWKSKDPFPGTERNEALIEYYQRVDYANATYHSYTQGWLTDRGMVHIIYGHPQSKRSAFSTFQNQQKEVWTYHHATYEFVDRTGFGDYVLSGPRPSEKFKFR